MNVHTTNVLEIFKKFIYEYAQIDFKYQQHNKCGNLRRGTRMKNFWNEWLDAMEKNNCTTVLCSSPRQ